MIIRGLLALSLALFVSACADMPSRSVTLVPDDIPRFPGNTRPRGVARSNADLAEDFLDLTFELENGERLKRLLKYEGPVRVALRSPGLNTYQPEISSLLRRIRREANIDIAVTDDAANAQIHVHAISRARISRSFPGAACFIVPGVTSWEEFRNPPGGRQATLWSALERLTVTSIFIPSDSTPQDTRDCLHEEIAQALGPANDLYRVPDTVFNDDNFHSVLTPFDMLMLRALYDPALPAGISRVEASSRIGAVLDRLNPAGRGIPSASRARAAPRWKAAIEQALNRKRSMPARRSAADRAVKLAALMTPPDHRLGLSLLTLGRVSIQKDPARATETFQAAYRQFEDLFGKDDIRTAHVALHLALIALRVGNLEMADDLARAHIPAARKAENAVVLSGLLAVRSETLLARGEVETARKTRVESLAWARYAFGDESGAIARAQAEIAAFAAAGKEKS